MLYSYGRLDRLWWFQNRETLIASIALFFVGELGSFPPPTRISYWMDVRCVWVSGIIGRGGVAQLC